MTVSISRQTDMNWPLRLFLPVFLLLLFALPDEAPLFALPAELTEDLYASEVRREDTYESEVRLSEV